jgi:hypothetical protein
MFDRNRILVAGSGRIARRIVAVLRAAGRRASRLDTLEQAAPWLPTAPVLIVADPNRNRDETVQHVARRCHRRSPRVAPLRLILLRSEGGPAQSPPVPGDARLSLEVFDLQEQSSRALLARWPPHGGMDPPFGQIPHVLIAGTATPARALLPQALRLLHYGDGQPVVTLACESPGAYRDEILAAYPEVGQVCRLRFTDIGDIELEDAPPVTGVFVCIADPEDGLGVARRLADSIATAQGVSPLVHLEVGDAQPAGGPGDWDGRILPFSWLQEAIRPEILLDGQGDELARVIHDHYRDSIAAQGRDPDAEPAGRAWQRLDESYRDASRHQADHLWAKLAAVDCRAVREELVESFSFAPLEVERLAVIEHRRWAADRYLDGWTYAPERDNACKHHPQLIPYRDLSDPMKDLDRFAVRLVPTLLARSGLGLVRMLLVGIAEPAEEVPAGGRLQRLADDALERLSSRYPDRSLVVASTLTSAASRLLVRRAVEHHEAGLFLLCHRPLSEVLGAQPNAQARRDLLALTARAERRVPLTGSDTPEVWLDQRAEIRVLLGAMKETNDERSKRVWIDTARRSPEWSFEY